MYDERMLQFLARLAEMHVDPTASDPRKIRDLPDDAISADESRPQWPNEDLQFSGSYWGGLHKDVGIFTEYDWSFIMTKCLASMGQFKDIEVFVCLLSPPQRSNWQTLDRFTRARLQIARQPSRWIDYRNQVGEYVSLASTCAAPWIDRPPASLARIIVYSMAPDSIPTPGSNVPTPALTPFQSGMNTPMPHDTRKGVIGDYLSAPLGKGGVGKMKTYLAGSKALDGLAKLIATVESFFHPSNSGAWTADVSFLLLGTVPFSGG